MAKKVSDRRLWILLIDRNIRQSELRKSFGLSSSAVLSLRRGNPVSMETLLRICERLDCDFGDIMEAVTVAEEK